MFKYIFVYFVVQSFYIKLVAEYFTSQVLIIHRESKVKVATLIDLTPEALVTHTLNTIFYK